MLWSYALVCDFFLSLVLGINAAFVCVCDVEAVSHSKKKRRRSFCFVFKGNKFGDGEWRPYLHKMMSVMIK